MSAFDDFREAVLGEAAILGRDFLQGNVAGARAVAEAFVTQSREKLERWTQLLRRGELTHDEFGDLVRSQKDLAQINALTQVGISMEKAEQFRQKLAAVVIDKAFDVLL
jgi:hypothetical protein